MANFLRNIFGNTYDRQAYQILRTGYVALPILAGLDKFAHVLVNWDKYVAPQFVELFGGPENTHNFMLGVGLLDIGGGLLVAFKPKLGGYLLGGWLLCIVTNLIMGGYYDIALRDFGLSVGAFALARLASIFDPKKI